MVWPDNPKTLNAARRLGVVDEKQGKFAEAEALQSQTSESMRRVLGPDNHDTLESMTSLAEALLIRNLEVERRVRGSENEDALITLSYIASMYQVEGKYGLAET